MAALNALVLLCSSANTLNFVEPRQKSNVLYCEKQTGKPISKNVETKTVTPVGGVNKKPLFSIWHHGRIGDLFGAI